jgi:hypothetical protein
MGQVEPVLVRLPRVAPVASLLLVIAAACGGPSTSPPELGAIALNCRMPIVKGPKVPCEMEVRDHAGRVLYADHAGVDGLEGSSSAFVKPSYGVELRDIAASSLSANFFGMGGDGDWVLDGFEADRSLMRSALVYDSFRAVGGTRYAPEGHYVTLSLNDVAQGIYRLVEKIKRDDDRVDVAGDDGTGKSFVVKLATKDDPAFPVGLGFPWEFVYPSETSVTPDQRDGFASWLLAADGAVQAGDAARLFSLFDRDALADWILLQELAKNIDAYTHDIHLVRSGGGGVRIVPWDFDLAFGQPTIADDTASPANDSPEGWITDRPTLIQKLAAVPELTARMARRWRALRGGPWSDTAISRRLDSYGLTLDPAVVASNFEIWDAASHDVGAEDAGLSDAGVTDAGVTDGGAADAPSQDDATTATLSDAGAPDGESGEAGPPKRVYGYYPVADYAAEVGKLRAFITARLAWIDGHIDGYPR